MRKFARYLPISVTYLNRTFNVPIQPISITSALLHQNICRTFSKNTPFLDKCWNCEKEVKNNQIMCDNCGHLQDIKQDFDYFELFSIPRKFNVDGLFLTQRFRNLQTMVHPDKFSNKTERDQINSSEWSSLINKAYKTLLTPTERGQYLLKLHGEDIPTDNSSLDKEFLMAMMEKNEKVEEAESNEQLDILYKKITQELNEHAENLIAEFEAKSLDSVKSILVRMKYLLSIQNAIKTKQQANF